MAKQTTWTLGINHGSHDSSVALALNGKIQILVEQERLSRRKRASGEAPVEALVYCLNYSGINLTDISLVALGSDHDGLASFLHLSPEDRKSILPFDDPQRLFPPHIFGKQQPPAILPVPHHIAHAASAYGPSGFDQTAILVVDAMGESTAGIIAKGVRGEIEILAELPIESSLGFYYEAASEFAGLDKNDAGKLMGLAGYGVPRFDMPLRMLNGLPDWLGVPPATKHGRALINERTASLISRFGESCFPYESGVKGDILAYKDFAASAQHSIEEVLRELALEAKRLTGQRRLAMAGGVALNCTANGLIAGRQIFDDIYVQPAAHDAGVAIGAALIASRKVVTGEAPSPSERLSVYLGPEETNEQIHHEITRFGWSFQHHSMDALADEAARLIANDEVLAWHQGRAENGPRALGARSLLGDPRTRRTLIRINRIKAREMWRPLAPSVLEEEFDNYFQGKSNPYMLFAAKVRPEKHRFIPATVHVDGTARPQSVQASVQPLYAKLLSRFKAHTGLPIVVNTSLNLRDEPIVNSARDTLNLMARAGIRWGSIGPFIVRNSEL